jgi:hypothetical protein
MLQTEWELFIYRLPVNPSRTRVAVWRELRRLGALPLQQSAIAVPADEDFVQRLDAIENRINTEGGTVYRFRLRDIEPVQQQRLIGEWNALRDHEYAEIAEECETRFRREVEFELFRNNLTGSEAEEIEADLEKIKTWFDRVSTRDRFGAPQRRAAEEAIERSQLLLDDFVERVFEAEAARGGLSLDPPLTGLIQRISEEPADEEREAK